MSEMQIQELDEQKRRFRQLIQEADSIEWLRWCQTELAKQMARFCMERARAIQDGDTVEVTEGPLSGVCGRVIAHCCHAADAVLVDVEGLALGVPLPIPAVALKVLVPCAVAA